MPVRSGSIVAAILAVGSLSAGRAEAVPMPAHTVVVMLENHDFSQFVGNPSAPFINHTLIPGGLLFANSHGVEHPSQPNYLDLFSGSNQDVSINNATPTNSYNFPAIYAGLQGQIKSYQGQLDAGAAGYTPAGLTALQAKADQIQPYVVYGTLATGDAFPAPANFNISSNVPFTTPNLGSSLAAAGKSFTEFAEGLSAAGAADANGNADPAVLNNSADPLQVGYAHRHDPAADWISDTPTGNQLPVSVVRDFTRFPASAFSTLPDVALVIPNTIHDGHDGSIEQGVINADTWLAQNLSDYLAWATTNSSLLIVTTDENDFSPGNHILTVMNGDPALFDPGISDQFINHFDLLRSLEDINGAACTAAACSATGLLSDNGRFAAVPEPTSLALLAGGLSFLVLSRRRVSSA